MNARSVAIVVLCGKCYYNNKRACKNGITKNGNRKVRDNLSIDESLFKNFCLVEVYHRVVKNPNC